MAGNEPIAPMSLTRLNDNFGDIQYAVSVMTAFDCTNLLQAWQQEAGARGKCVVIQVTLVDPEIYFGSTPDQTSEESNDQPD